MKDAVRGLKKFFQPRPQYITRSVGCEGGERSLALTGTALPEKMPRHVAIIMDGNGRWATRRGLPRSAGHAAGTEALRDIIRATDDWGIEALTIYAFSTENWSRGKDEVQALMGLLLKYFNSEIDELDEKNVRITILGDVQGMPSPQKEALIRAMERTGKNTGLRLNIALNYGGRAELVRAAKSSGHSSGGGQDPAGGHYRGTLWSGIVYRGSAGCGSSDSHQRGNAAFQFSALADGVCGNGVRFDPLAGLHPAELSGGHSHLRIQRSAIWRR